MRNISSTVLVRESGFPSICHITFKLPFTARAFVFMMMNLNLSRDIMMEHPYIRTPKKLLRSTKNGFVQTFFIVSQLVRGLATPSRRLQYVTMGSKFQISQHI